MKDNKVMNVEYRFLIINVVLILRMSLVDAINLEMQE
jgi:hypothetical protein